MFCFEATIRPNIPWYAANRETFRFTKRCGSCRGNSTPIAPCTPAYSVAHANASRISVEAAFNTSAAAVAFRGKPIAACAAEP